MKGIVFCLIFTFFLNATFSQNPREKRTEEDYGIIREKVEYTPAPPTSGCGYPEMATDNLCDDENNNAECNYDGGACCGNDMNGWDDFCTTCECLDPAYQPEPEPPTGCVNPDFATDNTCDDENNNAECNYDG